MAQKRGPKVAPHLEDLKHSTVVLDKATRDKLLAFGKNRSAAIREAVRLAYDLYQAK